MSNGPCDQCAHFRPKRRLDELLKILTDKPTPASQEMREREAQWESEESACLLGRLDARHTEWPGRPHVLAYCGLLEDDGIFFICESKNVNHESKHESHRCKDFTPATDVPRSSCSTCRHRDVAPGPEEDRKQREELIRIGQGIFRYDPNQQTFESGWGRTRQALESLSERVDSEKTTDMLMALDCDGVTPIRPRYYDTCRKYSRTGSYVLCRVRNYHNRCSGHGDSRPRTERPESSRARSWEDGGSF